MAKTDEKKFSKLSGFKFKAIIIDPSVLIKAFQIEKDSELVEKFLILNKKYQLSLLTTPLMFFEFLNVLSKEFKDEERVQKALKKYFKLNIGVIDATYGYLWKGIKAACQNKQVSYYDSSYHALAKDLDAIFLTADEKYFNMMKDEGHIALLSKIRV